MTYAVLAGYALYSLFVLAYVHRAPRLDASHGMVLHGLDVLWTAVLTFVSEGPVSPFFLFFLFVVLSAAYRWAFIGTLWTTALTIAVFLVQTAAAAAGPWNQTWFGSIDFELNRTILRVAYLMLTGFLLGYLAEQDKQSRAELAAIASITRQPRVDLGLGGSIAAIARALTNVFLLGRLRSRVTAAERARVARELHDGAIQALFGLEMKVEALRRGHAPLPPAAAAELEDVQELLRSEVLALRELMQALRPIPLDSSEQLPDVLASVVERFRRDTGVPARFVFTGRSVRLSPAIALDIVRIVQEALANVRKHSRARNVLVRLTADEHGTTVVIEDDGVGFAFEGTLPGEELDRRRLGPAIIKERARIAGAALSIDSTPGAGVRIELSLANPQ